VVLHRLCGAGRFGLPGSQCRDCPQVRGLHLLSIVGKTFSAFLTFGLASV
jgi:hypothetical protein